MNMGDAGPLALGSPALRQILIISVPDCMLVKSWTRSTHGQSESAAAHLGQVFQTAKQALTALGAPETNFNLTIENSQITLVLSEVTRDLVACFAFEPDAAMGMIRVQSKQLAEHIRASVAQAETSIPQRNSPQDLPVPPLADNLASQMPGAHSASRRPRVPRAIRLLELFQRYAPDPEAALLRLSLRTGIPFEALEDPHQLSEQQVEKIALAVRDILGADQTQEL